QDALEDLVPNAHIRDPRPDSYPLVWRICRGRVDVESRIAAPVLHVGLPVLETAIAIGDLSNARDRGAAVSFRLIRSHVDPPPTVPSQPGPPLCDLQVLCVTGLGVWRIVPARRWWPWR